MSLKSIGLNTADDAERAFMCVCVCGCDRATQQGRTECHHTSHSSLSVARRLLAPVVKHGEFGRASWGRDLFVGVR